MKTMLQAAKAAKFALTALTTDQKNAALEAMAQALLDNQEAILAANAIDLQNAQGKVAQVMLDRLLLTPDRIAGMAKGIREVAALPDPVGHLLERHTRADGLQIDKISVPMGVIAIIYESRPNVTSDAAALALKAGSVCILRGGKEAFASANAIVTALKSGLRAVGITEDAVNLVQDTSRASATALMTANGYVDLLIPRGGAGLINACVQNATVPCIATGTGICHVYVEATADQEMALNIIENAKTSRPSVCNAVECLLVHETVAEAFLAKAVPLLDGKNVELRCDGKSLDILGARAIPANESDWDAEYDDYILAIRTVMDTEEAIDFINAHGTGHSESIITNNYFTAQHFLDAVDAAAVYVNASTRFTDGGEFGLGAEIGISTQKMHARGPMGLEELTSSKYIIYGEGQVR